MQAWHGGSRSSPIGELTAQACKERSFRAVTETGKHIQHITNIYSSKHMFFSYHGFNKCLRTLRGTNLLWFKQVQ